MLDHVLLDFIAALRSSLDGSMLEKSSVEERFQIDVWLGDISFETSYTLPGEDPPPRLRADISLEWPTWSQATYRSWTLGEGLEDPPEIAAEIAIRLQRLQDDLRVEQVIPILSGKSPEVLGGHFELVSSACERIVEISAPGPDFTAEFLYEASLHFDEGVLEGRVTMEEAMAPLGAWLTSLLVRVADLDIKYRAPRDGDEH